MWILGTPLLVGRTLFRHGLSGQPRSSERSHPTPAEQETHTYMCTTKQRYTRTRVYTTISILLYTMHNTVYLFHVQSAAFIFVIYSRKPSQQCTMSSLRWLFTGYTQTFVSKFHSSIRNMQCIYMYKIKGIIMIKYIIIALGHTCSYRHRHTCCIVTVFDQ